MIFGNGDLGRFLTAWRNAAGLTQVQVAQKLGINSPIVASAETGAVIEAQNRLARIFFCQLGSYEAEELREIDDCVKLAKALRETRKWLRLTREIVASQAAMGVGTVAAAESPTFVAGIVTYFDHVLEEMAKLDSEQRAAVLHQTFMPWYFVIPVDSSIAKGARRPERFPEAGTSEHADFFRKARNDAFDGKD